MANFIKIIIFLIIVAGIGIYFFSQAPKIFQGSPREKISPPRQTFISPAPPASVPITPTSPTTPTPTTTQYLPQGFIREPLSPYFKKVKISSVSPRSWGSYPSEITLYFSSFQKGETINITGWKIKSNRSFTVIPQAVSVYEPSGFASETDIVLAGSHRVKIYSGAAPFQKNLRLNKCLGYLQNTYRFNPSLPRNCPSISRSEIGHLSGYCQSYILSLGSCRLPDTNFYNSLPGDEGNACRDFLNKISYGFCFQKHRFDNDFLSNEWRVWIGQNILDLQHDKIHLFDKQGLLVDEYSY
jgi:hypothetical protein